MNGNGIPWKTTPTPNIIPTEVIIGSSQIGCRVCIDWLLHMFLRWLYPRCWFYPPTMNHPGGVAEITMITTTITIISPECPYHKKKQTSCGKTNKITPHNF